MTPLLQGACALFANVGFDDFTIEMLCEEMRLDREDVTKEYKTKHTLFRAIYDEIANAGLLILITEMMTPGTGADRIDRSARAMSNFFLGDPSRARFFCVIAPLVQGEFADHRYRLLGEYVDALVSGTRLIADLDLTETQLHIGARTIAPMMETLVAEQLRDPENVTRRDVIRTLSHICRSVAGVGKVTNPGSRNI